MKLQVRSESLPPPLMGLMVALLLLLLLLQLLAGEHLHPVATATAAGSLGLAAFLLAAARPRKLSEAQSMHLSSSVPVKANPISRPNTLSRLPLSSQISADYNDLDDSPLRGGDLPSRLFQLVSEQKNPLCLDNWRCTQQKAAEALRVTHFAWTIPRWKGIRSVTELESAEFKDAMIQGVSWRCLLKRDPGSQRLLVLVKAAHLDPVIFSEGRVFAEISCVCGDPQVKKSSFGAFYPGVYGFVLGLDSHRLGSGSSALTISCNIAVHSSVPVLQMVQLPSTCQTDSQGRYVNCHSMGIRWQVADWEQVRWTVGRAVFSPLFSCSSLPGYLWQVHLFPASDDPSSAGFASVFVKLVDDASAAGGPVEVDFHLALQGDEDRGLFDTASFARGGTHGFRGIRRMADLRGVPLLVECAMRVKLPLFT